MKKSLLSGASNFSIVWGITLAAITLIEWHSLDRDPVRREILSPFIERNISVTVLNGPDSNALDFATKAAPAESPDAKLQYDVEFKFNGALFAACFFLPILLFQGVGLLLQRIRKH